MAEPKGYVANRPLVILQSIQNELVCGRGDRLTRI